MNVWDHLGELRKRVLICLGFLVAVLPVGVYFVNPFIIWLSRPVGSLVFVEPMEAFSVQLEIAVGISFLLALPVLLYHVWAFVAAGLEKHERAQVRWMMPMVYLCFMGGVAFSTFCVFPKAVEFLMTLKSQSLVPMLTISSFLDFFILLGLTLGVLFQLPLLMLFLAKTGILRGDILKGRRRMAYVVIFLVAAVFNPGPDVPTQLMFAGAIITLVELSMVLVLWETRRSPRRSKST